MPDHVPLQPLPAQLWMFWMTFINLGAVFFVFNQPDILTMLDHVLLQPLPIQLWMYWMTFINFSAVFFVFNHPPARWVLAAWFLVLLVMDSLFAIFGYTRILGLAHILIWTPLVIYLARKLPSLDISRFGTKYLLVVLMTNLTSLFIDYRDFFAWMSGDRAPI